MFKEIESGKLPAVLQSPTPFILQFASNNCPECQKMSSVLEQASDSLKHKIEVYYVNVDKVPEIKDKYQVGELPTMILFEDGKPQNKLVGIHSQQEVQKFLTH